ncbi:Mariner Mos1 transposase [Araneus ventricosus]|uniref:Mariner Mos1 transposase n=1 Tax=Araneus ventricosus TaxID=182803 RepID=A0A4Y2H7B8_ARAVE|nr:Mariner Mos1 transposase [Araneus ventricosus]
MALCKLPSCYGLSVIRSSNLQRYHEEEYGFLSHIVTGDETWCHHFELESKRQNKQWKHSTSPPPKKSKAVHTSSSKVMMSFFDHNGPLLVEFLERGTTINGQRYQATLQNLKRAMKSKRPGTLSNGVILLHDNARPHTANAVKTTLQQFRWETLEHPPYSPDLSPCDFHIFGPLKQAIRGHRFTTDDEVCDWVQAWTRQQPTSFFKDGIDRLVPQWDKCANSFGDYF